MSEAPSNETPAAVCSDFREGQRVVWTRSAKSGYGFQTCFQATVRKIGAKRVTIEIRLIEKHGEVTVNKRKIVIVPPSSLKPL